MRCLLRTQSHSRELTQSCSLVFMKAGYQFILSASSNTLSLKSSVFRNHWGTWRNSTGEWHLQQIDTFCWLSSCFMSSPLFAISSMIAFRASGTVMPAYLPARDVIFPSSSIPFSISRRYFMTHSRSSLSPMVQIMTFPVPYAGSTFGSDMTGTFLP